MSWENNFICRRLLLKKLTEKALKNSYDPTTDSLFVSSWWWDQFDSLEKFSISFCMEENK